MPSHEPLQALRWTADLGHAAVDRLDAKLTVSLGGGRGCTSTPECSIELWALDAQGEELVYCHSAVMRRLPCLAEVEWLGRSSHRPASSTVRGWRCVAAPGDGWLTVAEAMLGLMCALISLFGADVVELEVMDDGSGRLAQWYPRLGFAKVTHLDWNKDNTRKSLWMAAAPKAVAKQYSPAQWMKALLPPDFDAMAWLSSEVLKLWLERARLGRLPRWSWRVGFPNRAELHMEVTRCTNTKKVSHCLLLDASITGVCSSVLRAPTELVSCRCTVELQKRVLTVLWLGRRDGQPANGTVRGEKGKVFLVTSPDSNQGHGVPSECKVTSAVALLGIMAAVARWFGTFSVKLHARDDGSGKLINYLKGFGFVDGQAVAAAESGNSRQPWLDAPCDLLAEHCCPRQWHVNMLEAEDLNRFATVSFNRAELLEDDVRELQEGRHRERQQARNRRSSSKQAKDELKLTRPGTELTRCLSDPCLSRSISKKATNFETSLRTIESSLRTMLNEDSVPDVSQVGRRGKLFLLPLFK